MRMDMLQDFIGRVRAGNRQHLWMYLANDAFPGPQAAGNDDFSVFGQRLADGVERLFDRGIDVSAGIDDHQIGALIVRRNEVALGTQPGEDLF